MSVSIYNSRVNIAGLLEGGSSFARMLMEEHLGRMLAKNEVVHHIDGDSMNDDLSNLQVMTKSEHQKLHHRPQRHSEETKEKLRKMHLGLRASKETREKMRKMHLGLRASKETREKLRKMHLGLRASKETREKMRKMHLGLRASKETREKMSKSHQGRVVSENERTLKRERMLDYWEQRRKEVT